MDGIDITLILGWLKNINPAYAFAALAAWLVFQKVRSPEGLQLGKGGILDILGKILGKGSPALPPGPPGPPVPLPTPVPDVDESETLLDILAKRLKERLRIKALEAGDDHAAISEYAKIVKLLDVDGDGDFDDDDLKAQRTGE